MKDFNSLKVGDKLMRIGRRFGYGWGSGKFKMIEWVELEVTRVTPKFYFIGDKKYPKCTNGRHFGESHHFPGDGSAPATGNSDEFERQQILHRKLHGFLPHVADKLNRMPTIEVAAYFADRVRQLEAEMDEATNE